MPGETDMVLKKKKCWPVLKELIIMVFIGCFSIIFFSTNYTVYLRNYFQPEYLIHQDLKHNLSVFLLFLCNILEMCWIYISSL